MDTLTNIKNNITNQIIIWFGAENKEDNTQFEAQSWLDIDTLKKWHKDGQLYWHAESDHLKWLYERD